jgi:hypothetical protein
MWTWPKCQDTKLANLTLNGILHLVMKPFTFLCCFELISCSIFGFQNKKTSCQAWLIILLGSKACIISEPSVHPLCNKNCSIALVHKDNYQNFEEEFSLLCSELLEKTLIVKFLQILCYKFIWLSPCFSYHPLENSMMMMFHGWKIHICNINYKKTFQQHM